MKEVKQMKFENEDWNQKAILSETIRLELLY